MQRKTGLQGGCKLFLLVALLIGSIHSLYAESDVSANNRVNESLQTPKSGIVKGTVRDANDQSPMVGVNVVVMQGEKMLSGVITDADGNFELNVPQGAMLKLTYVGYREQLVTPSFKGKMEIEMEMDTNVVDEVVVNGFFTRQKSTFTGSAKSYTQENILKASPTNIFQALATLDPSLNINKNNDLGSNPNNIPDLVIRSTTSLATGNEVGLNAPLIVIDGVECGLEDLYNIDCMILNVSMC